MKQITVYTPQELKDKFPEAYNKAFNHWQENQTEIFWQDEIVESLKGLFEAIDGVTLQDYSIGIESYRNYVRFSISEEYETLDNDNEELIYPADFTGERAVKWLEANLYSHLRITATKAAEYKEKGYGKYYKKGLIKPCPFTGVCYDEDFIDCLNKNITSGMTIEDSLKDLAREAGRQIEIEAEAQSSEESFLESSLEFTEDGRIV